MKCIKCNLDFDDSTIEINTHCESVCGDCCADSDCIDCDPNGGPYTNNKAIETLAEIETLLLELLSDGENAASFDGMSVVGVVASLCQQFEELAQENEMLRERVDELEAAMVVDMHMSTKGSH